MPFEAMYIPQSTPGLQGFGCLVHPPLGCLWPANPLTIFPSTTGGVYRYICWVWPASNSDHKDYIFSRGSHIPSFATGRGGTPNVLWIILYHWNRALPKAFHRFLISSYIYNPMKDEEIPKFRSIQHNHGSNLQNLPKNSKKMASTAAYWCWVFCLQLHSNVLAVDLPALWNGVCHCAKKKLHHATSHHKMTLPTWAPGKMGPQTSPKPHKERNSET